MIEYIQVPNRSDDNPKYFYWKLYEDLGKCVLMEDLTEIEYYDMSDVTIKLRTRTVEKYLESKYKNVVECTDWSFTFNER